MLSFQALRPILTNPVIAIEFLDNWATILISPSTRAECQQDSSGQPDFKLSDEIGSCVCILAFDKTAMPDPVAPAVFLPLQWKKEKEHDKYLPAGIRRIADRVVQDTKIDGFSLHLFSPLKSLNFDININAESVWAPLTASLAVADRGGKIKPHIFATGAWSHYGISQVNKIKEKIGAIRQFRELIPIGHETKPVLFVPAANWEEAIHYADSDIEIRAYKPSEPDWRKAMAEHLEMLHAPPPADASIHQHINYLNSSWINKSSRQYRNHYIRYVAVPLAEAVRKRSNIPDKVERLVIGIGKNYELLFLLLNTLQPEQTIVLTTTGPNGTTKLFENAKTYLPPAYQNRVRNIEIDLADLKTSLTAITDFLDQASHPSLSAVEITGGTKSMTALLIAAAERSRCRIFYLDHVTTDRSPVIGDEKISDLDWVKQHEGGADYEKAGI